MSRRYAALLRAVNVGGRKLVMADLRRIAAGCGFTAPSTLLASGNLLLETTVAPSAAGEALRLAILGSIDILTDVFVRDAAQLQAESPPTRSSRPPGTNPAAWRSCSWTGPSSPWT